MQLLGQSGLTDSLPFGFGAALTRPIDNLSNKNFGIQGRKAVNVGILIICFFYYIAIMRIALCRYWELEDEAIRRGKSSSLGINGKRMLS